MSFDFALHTHVCPTAARIVDVNIKKKLGHAFNWGVHTHGYTRTLYVARFRALRGGCAFERERKKIITIHTVGDRVCERPLSDRDTSGPA